MVRMEQEEQISTLQNELELASRTKPVISWRRDQDYAEFRERVWAVNHPEEPLPRGSSQQSDDDGDDAGDDDLVMSTAKQTLTCPLSQTTLVEPVTNPSCGHTYSRAAITSLARSSSQLSCPIHGCSASVSIPRLVRNYALERRVARASQPRIFDPVKSSGPTHD
jgi:SUMO ligase MMS21 Smc5/6 complex component